MSEGCLTPKKAHGDYDELESLSKEELIAKFREQEAYVKQLENKRARYDKGDDEGDLSLADRLKQQQKESLRRENTLVHRLTTKEQELQEYMNQLQEMKQAQTQGTAQLRSMLLDPAVNIVFQRMGTEVDESQEKLKQTQNELSAWKFTPDSQTGKQLMTRCRMLLQENEDLGKQIASGRTAKLEGEIALQKTLVTEMKNNQAELDEFLGDLEEDTEGMQSMIYVLQQQLRDTNEQLAALQEENSRLRASVGDQAVVQVQHAVQHADRTSPAVSPQANSAVKSETFSPTVKTEPSALVTQAKLEMYEDDLSNEENEDMDTGRNMFEPFSEHRQDASGHNIRDKHVHADTMEIDHHGNGQGDLDSEYQCEDQDLQKQPFNSGIEESRDRRHLHSEQQESMETDEVPSCSPKRTLTPKQAEFDDYNSDESLSNEGSDPSSRNVWKDLPSPGNARTDLPSPENERTDASSPAYTRTDVPSPRKVRSPGNVRKDVLSPRNKRSNVPSPEHVEADFPSPRNTRTDVPSPGNVGQDIPSPENETDIPSVGNLRTDETSPGNVQTDVSSTENVRTDTSSPENVRTETPPPRNERTDAWSPRKLRSNVRAVERTDVDDNSSQGWTSPVNRNGGCDDNHSTAHSSPDHPVSEAHVRKDCQSDLSPRKPGREDSEEVLQNGVTRTSAVDDIEDL